MSNQNEVEWFDQAFPSGNVDGIIEGMNVRTWLVGQALAGLLSDWRHYNEVSRDESGGFASPRDFATEAVDMADAAINEMNRRKFTDTNVTEVDVCVICHRNPVDTAAGLDTCDGCLNSV